MGLKYNDLYDKNINSNILRKNLYRENTHVFAYFVMTAIFLNDYTSFMIWCKTYNEDLLKFNSTPNNFQEFMKYIEEKYNCISLLSNITEMEKISKTIYNSHKNNQDIVNTTRMSIIHTI